MLACSSKRAFTSTRAATCLPCSAARTRADTIGRVLGGAVERLFDGEHVRVVGGLGDERLHRGRERVVGVVHEHVPLSQHREQVDGPVTRRPRRGWVIGGQGGSCRSGRSRACTAQSCPRPSGAVPRRRRPRPSSSSARSSSRSRRRHVPVDLEPHGPPEAAAAELGLDGYQQVVGLALLEVQIGVARHPEGVVAADLHVREQPGQVGGDQLLEGTKREPPPAGTKRGSSGGTFTRANRSSRVPGSTTSTARLSDRFEM